MIWLQGSILERAAMTDAFCRLSLSSPIMPTRASMACVRRSLLQINAFAELEAELEAFPGFEAELDADREA